MLKNLSLLSTILIFLSCTGTEGGAGSEAEGEIKASYSLNSDLSNYDFGTIAVGSDSNSIEISFQNNGEATLTNCNDAFLSGENSSEFSISLDQCGTDNLAVGASCAISLIFSPQSEGSKAANITWRCDQADLTIPLASIAKIFQAPQIGSDQSESLNEDTTLNLDINPANSLEGKSLSYILVSAPTNGTLSNCMDQSGSDNSGDLSCDYQPNANFNGSDAFTYKANDGLDSELATVSLTINPQVDAPLIGADQALSGDEDTPITFNLNAATSIDGNALSYSVVSGPSNGTLTNCMDQTGSDNATDTSCSYQGNANYYGADSITYRVNDGSDSAIATLSFTVNSVIDAPTIGANQSLSTALDTALDFDLNPASHIEASNLVYSVVSAPTNGTLSNCMGEAGTAGDTDLSCRYTPDASFTGNDSFTYKVNNGADSEVATVSLEVQNNAFISIWRTTSASESITIPLLSSRTYNFTIDWGDGSAVDTVTAWNDPDLTHTYADAGDYTITIDGLFESIYINNNASVKSKLIQVVNLGDVGWKTMERAFYGCDQLTSIAGGNLSAVTSMDQMLRGASSLTSVDASSWDTGNVTTMRLAFAYSSSLVSLDLSNLDVRKVTTFYSTFSYMTNLQTLLLTNWDVAAALDLNYMFNQSPAITALDLSSFTTPNVTSMHGIFTGVTALSSLNISNFNTSKVTSMYEMFKGLSNLTSLDLSHFDTAAVTEMGGMFNGASGLTTINANNWDVTNVTGTFGLWGGVTATITCDQAGGSLFGKTCN